MKLVDKMVECPIEFDLNDEKQLNAYIAGLNVINAKERLHAENDLVELKFRISNILHKFDAHHIGSYTALECIKDILK